MARRRALGSREGFSLVEVLVVAAIGMVMFALAVPVIQGDDMAGSTARTVISDAVRARSYARRVWEPVTMQIDAGGDRWRTLKLNGTPLSDANTDADGWHHAETGIDFVAIDGMPTDLMFLPNGRASTSTAILIVTGHTTWRLSVDALNARITASEEPQP